MGAMEGEAGEKQVEGLSGHAMDPAEPGNLKSLISPRVGFLQHCSVTYWKGQGEGTNLGVFRACGTEGKNDELKALTSS